MTGWKNALTVFCFVFAFNWFTVVDKCLLSFCNISRS